MFFLEITTCVMLSMQQRDVSLESTSPFSGEFGEGFSVRNFIVGLLFKTSLFLADCKHDDKAESCLQIPLYQKTV